MPAADVTGSNRAAGHSPRSNLAYLQELEEAASSLSSTPMHGTPHTPHPNPFATDSGPLLSRSALTAQHGADEANLQPGLVTPFAQLRWSSLHCGASVQAAKLESLTATLQEAAIQCAMPAIASEAPIPAEQAAGQMARPAMVMQDVIRLQAASGIEHSALQDSQGQPLACHVQWKPGLRATAQQQISVNVGSVTMVHVPGLISDACTFAGLLLPAADKLTISEGGAASDAAKEEASTMVAPGAMNQAGTPQPSLTVSVSVLGVALGALSSAELQPHAVWLTCSRLSAHLGQIRARGRPGSLSAGLLELQQPYLRPSAGLRVSVMGVQLGIVPRWQALVDSTTLLPLGTVVISKPVELQALVQGWPLLQASAPPGVVQHTSTPWHHPASVAWPSAPAWQASSSSSNGFPEQPGGTGPPAQLQPHHNDQSPAEARLVSLAVSACELHMTAFHLAVLAAVAEAVTAETSRDFKQVLPQQAIPPESEKEAGMAAWLGCLTVRSAATYALLAMDREVHTVLTKPPPGLAAAVADAQPSETTEGEASTISGAARHSPAPQVLVMCNKVTLTVAVGLQGNAMPAVSITLVEPHGWSSKGVRAYLPACDMHVAVVSMLPPHAYSAWLDASDTRLHRHTDSMEDNRRSDESSSSGLATPSADAFAVQVQTADVFIQALGSPFAVISAVQIPVPFAGHSRASPCVAIAVQSISLDLDPVHIRSLVQFVQCTMVGPAIPVLPSYPPSKQPESSSTSVKVHLRMLFGQVQTSSLLRQARHGACHDLAFWMSGSSFSYSREVAQVGLQKSRVCVCCSSLEQWHLLEETGLCSKGESCRLCGLVMGAWYFSRMCMQALCLPRLHCCSVRLMQHSALQTCVQNISFCCTCCRLWQQCSRS